jgi:hypothetical protein
MDLKNVNVFRVIISVLIAVLVLIIFAALFTYARDSTVTSEDITAYIFSLSIDPPKVFAWFITIFLGILAYFVMGVKEEE